MDPKEIIHAPIFPLPTVTLFPETTAAFHIFEPRYKDMIESVLEGDGLLAMAVLKPGYEEDYYGTPEIHPIGVLGRIQSFERLENGNINIVLEGLYRVGFGEMIQDNPYRVGQMQALPEKDTDNELREEREDLLMRLHFLVEQSPDSLDFSPILREEESIISVVNLVARTLPLKNSERYQLLSMDTIRERTDRVLWHIDDQIETIELLKRVDPASSDEIILN